MSASSHSWLNLRLRGGGLYIWLTLFSLLVAALTLHWPSTPSYDPWSWLIWGRQILHGHLQLAGGPSWKPLPVIFTTVFALARGAQPNLWLVLARGGFVLSLLMTFKLAARLTWDLQPGTPPHAGSVLRDRSLRWLPALIAGLMAAAGLLLSGPYLMNSALGYSESLMAAATLIAIERLYDGHHRQAFAIGFLAALDRPEIWAFWIPYGLWLMWKDPGARKLVVGLFVLTVLLWFIPQRLGSASFTSSVTRARQPNPGPGSAAGHPCPFCFEMTKDAFPLVSVQVMIAAGLAMITALIVSLRAVLPWRGLQSVARRHRAMMLLCACGGAGYIWWLLVSIDVQIGFAGNTRYLVAGSALVWIAGSAAYGWAALELSALGNATGLVRGRQMVLATVTCVAMLLFVPKWVGHRMIHYKPTRDILTYQAHLRTDVSALLASQGAPAQVLACGTVMAEHFQIPMVAWYLKVPITTILDTPGEWKPFGASRPLPHGGWPNVILQTRATAIGTPTEPSRADIANWERLGARYTVVHDDRVTLYKDCDHA